MATASPSPATTVWPAQQPLRCSALRIWAPAFRADTWKGNYPAGMKAVAHVSPEGCMLRVQDPKQKGVSGADRAIFTSRDALAKTTKKVLRGPRFSTQCLCAPCLCESLRFPGGLPILNILFPYRVSIKTTILKIDPRSLGLHPLGFGALQVSYLSCTQEWLYPVLLYSGPHF